MKRLLSDMEMKLTKSRAEASRMLNNMQGQSFKNDEDETVDQWVNLRDSHRLHKKRNDSDKSDIMKIDSYPICCSVLNLTSKEMIEARSQAEESCRWIRIHNKPQNFAIQCN